MNFFEKDPARFFFPRNSEIMECSSSTSSLKGPSNVFPCKGKRHQHLNKRYVHCEWQRQNNPSDSVQDAPSLVPTTSKVCLGFNFRDGGHCRRIDILKRRIETALDGLEVLLRRRPKEPDGEDDSERRRTRSVEFLSRFSRNYLFQLRMQVMQLKRQMQCSSLASPGRHTQHQLLVKKLVAAHQTAVQGLQACLNQLPGSVHDFAILSKLDQLICYVCELTSFKTQMAMNSFLTGSEELPSQDDINTKAQNLLHLVRKRKKDREEAYQAWKQTATALAKKRFGLPSSAKSKAVSRPTSKEEKLRAADRRLKQQRHTKRLQVVTTKTNVQGEDSDLPPRQLDANDQPEPKFNAQDVPMDPATALELKIITSRMKDILRGANRQQTPRPAPTPTRYPPNVRLICITHSEDEPEESTNLKKIPESEKTAEVDDRCDNGDIHRLSKQTDGEKSPKENNLQEIWESKIFADTAEIHSGTLSTGAIQHVRHTLSPEEQRILRYRNRFRSYKEHISATQQTCQQLLSIVFQEVAKELEPSILLDKMYHLELQ